MISKWLFRWYGLKRLFCSKQTTNGTSKIRLVLIQDTLASSIVSGFIANVP